MQSCIPKLISIGMGTLLNSVLELEMKALGNLEREKNKIANENGAENAAKEAIASNGIRSFPIVMRLIQLNPALPSNQLIDPALQCAFLIEAKPVYCVTRYAMRSFDWGEIALTYNVN